MGREAERIVKEWHLPTAIHRFSVHATAAANVAMPHIQTPPSPSQAPTGLCFFFLTLSALDDEVTDRPARSSSVNWMIGSSGGLQAGVSAGPNSVWLAASRHTRGTV